MKKIIAAAAAVFAISGTAQASALIDNGTIALGVGDYGQLNVPGGPASPVTGTTAVGLRDLRTGYESTSHGCECEGWGVSVNGVSGGANNSSNGSPFGALSLSSFTSGGAGNTAAYTTGSLATSVTTLGGLLKVTHDFKPSASANLYQVAVTIENISGLATSNLLYRRTFDWDIEPTTFNEYSTIQGTASATNVIGANDNGFCSSDPLVGCSGSFSGDFIDAGPFDHGANFDFDFGSLAAGASYSFNIFYGAAGTERAALASLALVGAQVYSFGQAATDINGGNGSTFIFGFDGVGGTTVPGVPEVATWAQMLVGFGLAGSFIRARRRVAVAA